MLTSLAPASANSRASSPGWSGTDTNTERIGRTGPPCLPGIARVPATPRSSSAPSRVAVGRRDRVDQRVELGADLAEQGGDGVGVRGHDLLLQRRVAAGHPGDVADALPGQREVVGGRVGEPAGHQRRRAGGAGARSGRRPGRAPPG